MSSDEFDLFSTYLYLFGNKRVKYKLSFFLGRLLKHNPSLQFCREVVQMNKEELDPAEVKKVGPHHVD
jgi:hypothetical protein